MWFIRCIRKMKSYVIFEKMDEETIRVFLEWMREQERNVYRAAVAELAALKKLRPVYVRQKPVAEQYAWLKKMLSWKQAETIADHLLQVWLVRKHTNMLVSFLDTLGIAHNGQGVLDVLPETLDEEKLKKGVDDLFAKYPAGTVSLYLHMFQNQTPKGWDSLQKVLDEDPRITIR